MSPFGSHDHFVGDPAPPSPDAPGIGELMRLDEAEKLAAGRQQVGDIIRTASARRQESAMAFLFGQRTTDDSETSDDDT